MAVFYPGCTRQIAVPVGPLVNTNTPTDTFSPTGTFTATLTATPTFTFTSTFSFTPTITNTPSGPTATFTSTGTPTNTATATNTFTVTNTFTNTFTPTNTVTPTFTPTPTPDFGLIDDFEGTGGAPSDLDQLYVLQDQASHWRDGYWFSFDSATNISMNTAATGHAGSGVEAMGNLPTNADYAGFGFSFTNTSSPGCTNNCGITYYDGTVAGYTGISFWAKVGSKAASICSNAQPVNVDLVDNVGDHLVSIPLTTTWTQFTIYYNQVAGLTPTSLYQIVWKPVNTMSSGTITYDIFVDDIRFVSTANPAPTATPAAMVDDLENGDNEAITATGFTGCYWYTYNDGSGGTNCPLDGVSGGTFFPSAITDHLSGVGNPSYWACEYTGSGFTSWGSGVGLGLPNSKNYDLTRGGTITKIQFIAKAAATTSVRFKIPDNQADGSDNHGKDLSFTTSWATFGPYTLDNATFAQQGWGTVTTFSPQTASDLQWQLAASANYDILVDNITLLP
ncbi:MAG TPA: hypothetical protein VHE12_10560 [bacterium]|nr:hypothetical protein [bacterium]